MSCLLIFRFGFVSFEDPESVKKILSQGSIFFQGKKVNIGPAVKKQVSLEESPLISSCKFLFGIRLATSLYLES